MVFLSLINLFRRVCRCGWENFTHNTFFCFAFSPTSLYSVVHRLSDHLIRSTTLRGVL